MNILFINEFQVIENQGGVQRVTKTLSNFFHENRYNVFNIFLKQIKSEPLYDEKEFKFFNSKINSKKNRKLLKDIIIKKDINLIINQWGFNYEIVKMISNLNTPVAVISVMHSCPDYELKDIEIQLLSSFNLNNSLKLNLKLVFKSVYKYYIKYKISKKFRLIYQKSDAIIFLSSKFIPVYVRIGRILETDKLFAIPNPVDTKFISNIQMLNKEKVVLSLGRLNKGKRIDLMLEIWKEIETKHADWNLKIVGDGPELRNLKQTSKGLNIKNIFFQGHVKDVEAVYKKASILIMTSAYEGFPMTIVESQNFGVVPIVYDTFESVTDLINDDINGFIIPNLDKKMFIRRIEELMDNDEKRNKMSQNCIEGAHKFNVDVIGQEWLNIINKITNLQSF